MQPATAADREYSLPPDSAEPDPDYRGVLDWVWSFSARRRTADEIIGQRAVKLDRMRALLHALDDPQEYFESLLVAGTKGKGSTAAMLAGCLYAAGMRTGRYTSPHLVNWRERTWVNGMPISTDAVLSLAAPIRAAVDSLPEDLGQPTTFEIGTAFAFANFARQKVQVAVVECGVGGRYDATNVVEPLVSAITPISYDHTGTLGTTLTSIADHKAGVLRPGRVGIVGRQPEEARLTIERAAAAIGAPLEEVGREWTWHAQHGETVIESILAPPLRTHVALLGDHQRDNATTAVAALHALRRQRPELAPSQEAIQEGLRSVNWPGRLQVLQRDPLLVLDGAHNAFSAQVLARALVQNFAFKRLLVVLGLSEGKDAQGVLAAVAEHAERLYITRSRHERSADPRALAELAHGSLPTVRATVYTDVSGAIEGALREAQPEDAVVVTGSLFLIGEALVWWARSLP
jgi:dihydrofolate synthase / folylpolyglutamate synthase